MASSSHTPQPLPVTHDIPWRPHRRPPAHPGASPRCPLLTPSAPPAACCRPTRVPWVQTCACVPPWRPPNALLHPRGSPAVPWLHLQVPRGASPLHSPQRCLSAPRDVSRCPYRCPPLHPCLSLSVSSSVPHIPCSELPTPHRVPHRLLVASALHTPMGIVLDPHGNPTMSPACSPVVSLLQPYCMPRLHPHCSSVVSSFCTPIVPPLYSCCSPITPQMKSHYTPLSRPSLQSH